MPNLLARTLTAAMLSVFSAAAAHAGDIAVEDPFARASAGPVKVGAAFMIVKNSGAAADALVALGTGPIGLAAGELIDSARALLNARPGSA